MHKCYNFRSTSLPEEKKSKGTFVSHESKFIYVFCFEKKKRLGKNVLMYR